MQTQKTKILSFAGQIGSGKSTISKQVADKLGWKRVGFGDFLRGQVIVRGLAPQSRSTLQNLGQEFINRGWRPFCSQVLETAGWIPGENLVVDGIRHVEALDTLLELTHPSDGKLVYITTAESMRMQRIATRDSEKNLAAESHPMETEGYSLLPTRADLLIDNSSSVAQTVEKIIDALDSWIAFR